MTVDISLPDTSGLVDGCNTVGFGDTWLRRQLTMNEIYGTTQWLSHDSTLKPYICAEK